MSDLMNQGAAVTLPGAQVLALPGIPGSGHLFVASPFTATGAGDERLPVLIVLDAGMLFATTVETVRMRARRPDATGVGPAWIVGLDIPKPARNAAYGQPEGAVALLDFLEGTLLPDLAQRLPIDPSRAVLLGHSLSGCFVLRVLVSRPMLFRSYVSISPSIWVDRDGLFAAAADIGPRLPPGAPPRRVHVAVGEYEQGLAPWQRHDAPADAQVAARRAERRMVDNARDLAAYLAEMPGLDVRFQVHPAEDHASMALLGLHHSLRFVLNPTERTGT